MKHTTLKKRLLTFAKSGGDRTKLSPKIKARLYTYMSAKNSCYDIEFCRELMEIAPYWFKNHTETPPGVDARKQHMLECAAVGMSRGTYFKNYGQTGRHYLSDTGNSYDPAFTEKLKAIAPDWFPKLRVERKKQQLLEFAKTGAELPKQQNNLLKATFHNYTRFEYPCFDPVFRKQIETLRPDWF